MLFFLIKLAWHKSRLMQHFLVLAIALLFFILLTSLFLIPGPPTELLGDGEMPQLLRALAILPEDVGSFPSIQVATH